MSYFEDETALTPLSMSGEQYRWSGRVDANWNIGSNPNGGYLVSIVTRALRELCPEHPDPLTLTVHYLRPGLADKPCEVHAEQLRAGRTLSTMRATLIQENKARLEVLAGFGNLGIDNCPQGSLTIAMPDIPAPEACVLRSADEQGVVLPLLNRLEVRIHADEARASMAGKAQVSGWVRFIDGQSPDTLAAILFADAYPPSIFGLLGGVGWAPTVELTVHVRKRPVAGWLLGQFKTHDLTAGRMIEDGLLWDARGDLIAQSRQIGLVLSPV